MVNKFHLWGWAEKFIDNQDTLIESDQIVSLVVYIFREMLQCLDPIGKNSLAADMMSAYELVSPPSY